MQDMPLSRSGRPALEVVSDLVRQAGGVLLEHFHEEKGVSFKGPRNVVTNVDLLSEELLLAGLRKEFPGCAIVSEESLSQISENSGYVWYVDPLDGSRNYASGLPVYTVTLALVRGGDILLGCTYDPPRNELFTAEKGRGSFLNGQRISVSKRENLRESLPGMDMGYHDERARLALHLVTALWPGMQSLRVMGSAALALAYVAAGRLDIYFHHDLAPWDVASGILLVQEAAGTVTDKSGDPVTIFAGNLIASNAAVHADFLHLTRDLEWRKA